MLKRLVARRSIRQSANTIFNMLLSFIIATSVQALLYAILIFNGIYLPDVFLTLLLLISIFILFYILRNVVIAEISYIDYVIAMLALMPIIVLYAFSRLPLGDDLRYIGAALLYPNNSFISLIGHSVLTVSRSFNVDVVSAYWVLVFLSIYTLALLIISILKKFFNFESNIELAVSLFMIIYVPSLISLLVFPKMLHEPYEINNLIFNIYEFHYIGRNVNLDPSLLKNISVLLSFLPLLLKNINGLRSALLMSFLWMLAYLYHPLNALVSIVIATAYMSIFFTKQHYLKNTMFIIRLALIIALMYSLIANMLDYSVLLFLWNENRFVSICVNAVLVSVSIAIGFIAIAISNRIGLNRTAAIAIIIVAVIVLSAAKVPIEPELFRYIDLKAVLLYGYYTIVVAIYAIYKYGGLRSKIHETQLITLMIVPPTFIIAATALIGNSIEVILRSFEYPAIVIYRYIQVISRIVTTPAFGLSLVLFSIPIIVKFTRKTKSSFLIGLRYALILLSIIQLLFFVSYWGFYYRNPWADGTYNADIINNALSFVNNAYLNLTPYVHAIVSQPSIYLRDILGLKIGIPMHTPTSINDSRILWDLRNIVYVIPDIVIADDEHNILIGMFEPKYTYDFGGRKVYIYVLQPINEDRCKLALIGPIPSPILAPNYYRELIGLQKEHPNCRLVVVPSEGSAIYANASVIGGFKLIEPFNITDSTIDLKSLWSNGYRYLYIEPEEVTTILKIEVFGNRPTMYFLRIGIYPDFISVKGSLLLSIEELAKNVGWSKITIYDAKLIIATKNYYIDLK